MPAAVRAALLPALLVALAGLPAAASAQATAKAGSLVTAREGASPAGGTIAKGDRKLICRGAEVPSGWILVDDVKDPSTCGGENPAVLNQNNVWVIEKHEAMAAGALIDVCVTAPIPKGWSLVDIFRDKSKCGHPADLWAANVKRLRKG